MNSSGAKPVAATSGGRPTARPTTGRTVTNARELSTIVLTALGSLMVAIDTTIVVLALPTMTTELRAPLESTIWTILIYLLITTTLTTQAGKLGDLFGLGRVYNVGFAVFTIGSALCGFAPSSEILIAARAIQAIGGALVYANGAALISYVFPPLRRGRAFGFLVLGWSVGAILGILLGGVITTTLGWRYIFFINLPIGVGAVALGLRTLPRTERKSVGFDVPGFLAFATALTFLCYGAIEIASYGVTALYAGYVGLGLALLPVFVAIELGRPQPMVELRQLKRRLLGFSLMAGFLQALGYLSVIFLLTMYLQGLRGLSPLNASLLLVPGYVVGAFMGPFFGRYVDRIGPRALATGGIACMAVAILLYSTLGMDSWLGWVPMISLFGGIGSGMFYPANTAAIMSQATPSTFGSVSGLRGTLMNMGTLLSFVFALTIASATVPRYVAYEVFLGTASLVGGIGQEFLDGLRAAFYGAAAILALAAVLSWTRGRAAPAGATETLAGTAAPPQGTEEPDRIVHDPLMVEGEGSGAAK